MLTDLILWGAWSIGLIYYLCNLFYIYYKSRESTLQYKFIIVVLKQRKN